MNLQELAVLSANKGLTSTAPRKDALVVDFVTRKTPGNRAMSRRAPEKP